MAKEIQAAYDTGSTLKAVVLNSVGQAWYTTTPVFENWTTAHIANYGITMTEQGTASGIYEGDFPSSITAGVYSVIVYKLAGGSLAESDLKVAQGQIHWSGSAVYGLNSIGAVAGAVGSVTGNVGGYVAGSVGSVSGNVGGNVVGSVASVVGTVGSVIGDVGGNVTGSVGSVLGDVGGNIAGDVNGNVVGSVASVTASVTVASFGSAAIDAAAFDVDALAAIADTTIARGVDNVEADADPLSLAMVILARSKASISGGTLTVYQSDGSTPFTTFTITTSSSADPIVSVS